MDTTPEKEWWAAQFEEHRGHLRGVAYRMLGSASDADDAVQEAWLRLNRAGADSVENLPAWLTTVVARVCLNMLRSRQTRGERPLDQRNDRAMADQAIRPEDEALLADSVGLALLVVLDMLTPAERLAFVLHDMFDLPFDEIGSIVDRSPAAARQLASRARRRVRGRAVEPVPDLVRQRRVVDAYLAATRDGDFQGLIEVLDPDVVLRADESVDPAGVPVVMRGAQAVAEGALASSARARFAQTALVGGRVGLVMAPRGSLFVVLQMAFTGDRITDIEVIAEPDRLRALDLAVLDW